MSVNHPFVLMTDSIPHNQLHRNRYRLWGHLRILHILYQDPDSLFAQNAILLLQYSEGIRP